jgi:hypothetical protein
MQAGGQQTVNDYYANLRKDAEAYLANPNAPRGVEAYNVLLQSGISTSDLINAGVDQAVLDKIFAVDKFIPQSQFVTPTGMTSAYERSPDLAFESQRLTAQGQDGRAILDKQGRDYIANLQQGGIDAAERAQMLEYATERGYSFDDLMKAGVDPNVLFNVVVPPMPGSALAPPVFTQTQPTYTPPTVYQQLPTQPDIFAAGQPALDTAFRESSPRTAILDKDGRPTGQFDYSPAAKLRPATGAGFTFTPPSVTSRPRSLLSPREIQAYGGMTSKSQQFAANRAAIDRSLRRLQAASPALSNPSAYALLRNRIMAQDFGNPQRVFDPKTGEVNLTTEEGQSFLKAVNALAAASPAKKAAAEKAVKTDATVGTGATDVDQTDGSVIRGSGSTTQPGGYAAAIDGGDKITYGGYDILQQAKGGLVKKPEGSAKDELARFANGGEADAELLRRQLEGIDNTPTARTPERAPTPEQTESRTMLENLRSGFAQIPQTVMGYGRDVLQSEDPLARVRGDVSALGSGALESIKQDPLGTLADMTPILGEIRSGRDAVKYSDLANEARAANDLDAAAMYEQMSTLAAAGATPLIGTAGRIGRRIAGAPDEAMMNMAVKSRGGVFRPTVSESDPTQLSGMGQRLEDIASSFKSAGTPDDVASNIVEKARKYFTTSFGTADDPLRVAILEGRLNPVVPSQYEFRDYLVDAAQASYRQQQDAGRGGVDDQLPVSSALEDFTRMYDRNTGLQGKVYTPTKPSYEEQTALEAGVRNRLIAEGVPEELINESVSVRNLDETGYMSDKEKLFRENLANTQDKTLAMALQKNEPIYDMDEYVSSAMSFLSPRNLARAAQEIPLTTLEKMSFPELVIKTAEIRSRDAGLKDAIAKAKQNKKVLPKYFLNEGVKPVIDAGPNERWYQITDSKYTPLEGNAMGHSVGGYAEKGDYNAKYREDTDALRKIGGKEAFDKGFAQVYTLRNTKTGLPAITVEVQNQTPVSIGQTKNPQVSQIQGFKNGMPFSTEPVFKLLKKLGVSPENTPRSQGYWRNTKGEELADNEYIDWRSMYQDYLAQNPGSSTFAKGGEVSSAKDMLDRLTSAR